MRFLSTCEREIGDERAAFNGSHLVEVLVARLGVLAQLEDALLLGHLLVLPPAILPRRASRQPRWLPRWAPRVVLLLAAAEDVVEKPMSAHAPGRRRGGRGDVGGRKNRCA